MRREKSLVFRQCRRETCHFKRRNQRVSLPDDHIRRIAGSPAVVQFFALPLRRRDTKAVCFVRQINSRRSVETVTTGFFVQFFNAQLQSVVDKKRVAAELNCLHRIEQSVTAALVASDVAVSDAIRSRTIIRRVFVHNAVAKQGGHRECLES